MVTCVVTGCCSGYKPKKAEKNDDRETKEKVHWHKFPDDKARVACGRVKFPEQNGM